MKRLFFVCTIVFGSVIPLASGCGSGDNTTRSGGSDKNLVMDAPHPATVESHAHPSEGPHHGTLIELGNEAYHAELVHDDTSVTVYVLDASASKTTPIDAVEVSINLVHDGKPLQFKLAAAPESNDPPGKSSRFSIQSAELIEELEHAHSTPKLSVMIEGKSYRGEIHHDHHGHDHDH